VKISSRRKSSGVIRFSPVVKNSRADSAPGRRSWPLEALPFAALEEGGGAVQQKAALLARGHTRRPVLARAMAPESLAWLGALRLLLPRKDSFS